MRKLLNLISEPLNIEALYEQTIFFPVIFKNGNLDTDRLHIGDYQASFTVWKNNPNNPILECTTEGPDSNKISISSSQNDEILDQITIFSDFLQSTPTNAALPSDTYLYRLNMISPNGVDNFVLNGNFIVRDSAPDWYEVPETNPNTILVNGTIVSVVVNSISLNQKVLSVNGKQGDVVLEVEDIGLGANSSSGFSNILSWFQFIWKLFTGFTFAELSQITDAQLALVQTFKCKDEGRIRNWKYVEGNTSTSNDGTVIVTSSNKRIIAYGYSQITPENFGAIGDGINDDTSSLQSAINFASDNNFRTFAKGNYLVTDTITINKGSYKTRIEGTKVGTSTITFNNNIIGKELLFFTSSSSYSTITDLKFVDAGLRKSSAVRINSNKVTSKVNWKNSFERCRWEDFLNGAIFGADGDPHDGNYQDWSSENSFINCKFRNCKNHLIFQNRQSFNNNFISTDFENDYSGSNESIIITDECGASANFIGCSIISAGSVYEFINPSDAVGTLWNNGLMSFTDCRFESRIGHVGYLFLDRNTGFKNTSKYNTINIKGGSLLCFQDTIDFVRYSGRLNMNISDFETINGIAYIKNNPVQGITSTNTIGSTTSVLISNSRGFKYLKDTANTYGTYNRRYTGHVKISDNVASPNGSYMIDAYGFHIKNDYEIEQLPFGLCQPAIKNISFNDDQESAGYGDIKLILPPTAKPIKLFIFKHPVRYSDAFVFNLHLIKDNSLWVNPASFNLATDSLGVIASIASTANKAGYFESNVNLATNSIGNKFESGSSTGWTEGRVYIEKTGSSNQFGGIYGIQYI